MIAVYIISVKRNFPKVDRAPLKEIIKTFLYAFWAIGMTVLILWGILGGVFTPTEAAVVAVAYALIVGVFIYKELKIKDIPRILCNQCVLQQLLWYWLDLQAFCMDTYIRTNTSINS